MSVVFFLFVLMIIWMSILLPFFKQLVHFSTETSIVRNFSMEEKIVSNCGCTLTIVYDQESQIFQIIRETLVSRVTGNAKQVD